MDHAAIGEIISFWRAAGPDKWFEADEDFDPTIRSRFLSIHEAAARGDLAAWEEAADARLP